MAHSTICHCTGEKIESVASASTAQKWENFVPVDRRSSRKTFTAVPSSIAHVIHIITT